MSNRFVSPRTAARIAALYLEGRTQVDIALILSLSRRTIYRHLKKSGLDKSHRPILHGHSGYQYGCRCQECKNARSAYMKPFRKLYRQRKKTAKALLPTEALLP